MNLSRNERETLPLLIEGKPQIEIAQTVGICQQRVSQIANKENIREIVEKAQQQLINQSLNTAIANQSRKIELANIILSGKKKKRDPKDTHNIGLPVHQIPTVKDSDILELAEKAEQRIMQSVGIAPSHAQSLVFTQIFNQTNQVLSPEVLKLMDKAGSSIIDIELGIPGEKSDP